jgi:hypothetical protein
MAQTTRSTGRTPARFGRTPSSPPARRFGRQGAPTTSGRFPRPGTSASRPRRKTPPRTSPFARVTGRKAAGKKKGLAGTIAGLLPTGAAAKATPSSKKGKAGGFLALAAAAGVALRNREKLTAMAGRGRDGEPREEPAASPEQDSGTTVPRPGDTAEPVPRPESGGAPNTHL